MIMKKKSQMVKVNLAIENKNWKSRYPTVNSFLTKSIKKILSSIFSSRAISFEISILLTGTKNMKNLNKKFRKINKDTDVLSFPAEEKNFFNKYLKSKKKVYLGDIALSYQYIETPFSTQILLMVSGLSR
jgi:probable rRNA maturation factor